jgi:regulator of RNase E activity RraA
VKNPFLDGMVRMQLPAGMGGQISVSGYTMDADADGCVTVSREAAKELLPHGLVPVAAEPAKKK